jgi:hypothetical protein
VHGVVARAVGGLRARLPGLVRGVDFVPDVARVDGVERVLLFRVVERDAEGGAAGEGEVVGVARVLLGVEVRQRGAVLPEAVQVRGLADVADDVAEVVAVPPAPPANRLPGSLGALAAFGNPSVP